jgi:phenylacetate-CoA ligase
MFVALDLEDWDRTGVWMATVADRVGFGPGDVLLNTHCYGLWVGGPALDLLAARSGACLVPLGPTSPARVIELLRDGVGTAISATPSYMRRLIEYAESTDFDLTATGLRLGFIGAEPAEPALRQKLLTHLPSGYRWVELFGLTETAGPAVAFSPEPTVLGSPVLDLEINTADFLVEVLDPHADEPVAPGAVGELTLTTRRTDCRTPLLRYRTRDLVRATEGDPGDATSISPIMGRVDDSVKVGGVLMYPTAVAEVVTAVLPATAEWRAVVQKREEDYELLLEVEASPDLCRTLVRAFDERIGMHVTAVPVTEADVPERSREKTRRLVVASEQPRT